jgi:hypothetical protein
MLAAADLMARGFAVYYPMARQKGYDLVAVDKKGRMLSIEVRSGRLTESGKPSFMKKVDSNAKHHAIVMTGHPVVYEPELPTS